MIQQGRHRPVSSRDAIERRAHLSVLHVLGGLVVQQVVGAVGCHAVGGGEGPLFLPHGHGEGGQADANVFEGVEQEDPHDDGEEATEGADHVVRAHVTPLLEEDGRAGEHRRGEEHVVDGRHQGGQGVLTHEGVDAHPKQIGHPREGGSWWMALTGSFTNADKSQDDHHGERCEKKTEEMELTTNWDSS